MALAGQIHLIRSDKDVHFTGAIAQNAGEAESILFTGDIAPQRYRIRSLNIISEENLAWEVVFFARSTFNGAPQIADIDLYTFLGYFSFGAGDAIRIAATGPYLYYIDGLDIAYEDQDESQTLHLMLVNRSAAAKTAGAAGEVVVQTGVELELGW